ncbi:MAG: 2-amino-4-hydroxy-6-hydroxymethyldihydropteridine diphosphokinase [Saccharospirillum sp.]|nr:2-amino-4-hydroxy-6-hydroxymethyldihydropteridine diphosphokinase [Saccharospirillum sp.]
MSQAWIALGSNLGVSENWLELALEQLNQLPQSQLLACSPWYRSAAIGGPADQPDYLNAVCQLQTTLPPLDLLHALQQIEAEAGRERLVRWAPRTLDLDIICYDAVISNDPELTLPHPRAHQRAFVLRPLADLTPDLRLHGKAVKDWLPDVADQRLHRHL